MPLRIAHMTQTVRIPVAEVRDAASFHSVFAKVLGFPAFYGRNMDAWIDCMSDLRRDTGMTSVRLAPDEILMLELPGYEGLRKRCPEVVESLLLCTSAVNRRFTDDAEPPAIALLPC